MGRLDNKIIIITGGTKGIGLETSLLFVREGARVIACARNEKIFDEHNIEFMKLDVTDFENCKLVSKKFSELICCGKKCFLEK